VKEGIFMKIVSVLILSVASAVFFVACGTPRGPYNSLTKEDVQSPHQLSSGITMLDIDVRNAFLLINHTASRTPGGQIQTRITMQNAFRNGEDLWADVRFVFYNKQDQPVDASQWKTIQFPPMDLILVEGSSMRADIMKYNAQFRNLSSKSGKKHTFQGRVYEHGYWKESILPN
jgi:hypothetical protein